jgi:energy-coupling factor transport system substrate-specific component
MTRVSHPVRKDWEEHTMTEPTIAHPGRGAGRRWRTVDIVVASAIAVAFGVVFWAWNTLWSATGGAFAAFPPAQALLYGVWLLPAVLGGLVIRKPGAAAYCEIVAALVSVLLGSAWGTTLVLQGIAEGLGGELVFLLVLYRAFGLPVAAMAGAAAGFTATVYDAFVWYADTSWTSFRAPYIGFGTLSSTIIAGVGAWALTRALAGTGVLDRFPAGRERTTV